MQHLHLCAWFALSLCVCTPATPPAKPGAKPPAGEVAVVDQAGGAGHASAGRGPADESLRRLIVIRRFLQMSDCGHDEAVGELRCALSAAGDPQPTQDVHTLRIFVTDPPGLVLAAAEWQSAPALKDADAVVADCRFDKRGTLDDVRLAATKGIAGWLYAGSVDVGVASECNIEPYQLPEPLSVAHLLVMHNKSRSKPYGMNRRWPEAAALARKAAVEARDPKADFGELVKRYTEEPGGAQRKGSLGDFKIGNLVPEFEMIILATPIGARSVAFETTFGFHVLERHR